MSDNPLFRRSRRPVDGLRCESGQLYEVPGKAFPMIETCGKPATHTIIDKFCGQPVCDEHAEFFRNHSNYDVRDGQWERVP